MPSVGEPYSIGFTKFSEPDTWTVDSFYTVDAAGNCRFYPKAELAAFDRTSVNVLNDGGYDATPPALASGNILTTTVRLSKRPPGTAPGTLPYVSADMSIVDGGNGVVSGTYCGDLT